MEKTNSIFSKLRQKGQNSAKIFGKLGFLTTVSKMIHEKVTYLLQVKDLNEKINGPFNDKLTVQRAEKKHSNLLREFSEKYDESTGSMPFFKIERYFDNQYNGLLAFLDDDLIGYMWWVDNKISPERNHPDLILYEIELNEGDAYGTNTYIAPPYRGNANSLQFLNKVFVELRKMGFHKLYGMVNFANISALWTYNALGIKTIKKIHLHKFFNYLMAVNKVVYIANSWRHPYHPLGPRILFSFRPGVVHK